MHKFTIQLPTTFFSIISVKYISNKNFSGANTIEGKNAEKEKDNT
jgi:hypothetical protein